MLLFFFDSMLNFPHRNFEITRVFTHAVTMSKCYNAKQSNSGTHNWFYRYGKTGNKKRLACLATLLQKELNSDVARFATHIKLVLQQICLLLVAKSCCRKYRLVLLFATKSVLFTRFTSAR